MLQARHRSNSSILYAASVHRLQSAQHQAGINLKDTRKLGIIDPYQIMAGSELPQTYIHPLFQDVFMITQLKPKSNLYTSIKSFNK